MTIITVIWERIWRITGKLRFSATTALKALIYMYICLIYVCPFTAGVSFGEWWTIAFPQKLFYSQKQRYLVNLLD